MRTVGLLLIWFVLSNALCFGSCLVDDCGSAPAQASAPDSSCHHHQEPKAKPRLCSHPNSDEPSSVSVLSPAWFAVSLYLPPASLARPHLLDGIEHSFALERPPDLPPHASQRAVLRI